MALTKPQLIRRSLGKYVIIYPFLYLVGFIDFVLGLILPYKYEDNKLPEKDAILAHLTDSSDPTSPYRSNLFPDLIKVEDKNANLFDELSKCSKMYNDLDTMGVRELISIDDELQPNGKVFKKFSLGSYKWSSYEKFLKK